MNLEYLEQLVAPMMQNYRYVYQRLIYSDIPILSDISEHIVQNSGKQLRPLMTMLTACNCGMPAETPPDNPVFDIAAAVEMLHNSTLIHDDVIDESELRRGEKTVNHIWGNKTAVLAGDYYLAKVMQTLENIDNKKITHTINDAVIEMSEGELIQQQYCNRYDTSRDTYFQIIGKKTAVFMAACCKAGAICATDNSDLHEQAYKIGYQTGIAFQLRDDMIDFMPSSHSGKPQCNDIKEHKATLPIIITLQDSDTDTKKELLTLLQKKEFNDNDIARIAATVLQSGALEEVRRQMNEILNQALQSLSSMPNNRYRDGMSKLIESLKEY